jgi:hypothetical protein
VLIAEVVPNRARAGAAAILQSAAALGPILAAVANQALAHESWRAMYWVGVVPALLTIAIRYGVKEPERWTQSQAHTGSWIQPLKDLFSHKKFARYAVLAMLIGAVGIAGANNIAFWMPNLVKEALPNAPVELIRAEQSRITYFQHAGTLLGVFIFPWLCNLIGRTTAIAAFFIGSMAALAGTLYSGTTVEALHWKAPLLNFFIIGVTAGFGLYFPELFATRFRATGSGLAYNVARVLNVPVPIWMGAYIASHGNSPAAGLYAAGAIYIVGLLVLPFLPETKGKPLMEDEPVRERSSSET